MKNFNIDQNVGDSSTDFFGEMPTTDSGFIQRYLSDNDTIKEGIITEVYMGGFVAQVKYGTGTGYAFWLSELLGGNAGTNMVSTMASGTKVLVWRSNKRYGVILGAVPSSSNDEGSLYEIENGGQDFFDEDQHAQVSDHDNAETTPQFMETFNNDRPMDAYPGDWGVVNELGNVVALLRGLVVLKATDVAQLQINQVDDLVRIISRNFEHLSSIGDDNIYDDHGAVSREISMSTTSEEANGGELGKDGAERAYEPIDGQEVVDRIKLHLGRIGDLVHLYTMSDTGNGLSELHLRTDGAVDIKSVKNVTLSRTSNIRPPKRTQEYHESTEAPGTEIKPFEYKEGLSEPQESDRAAWENGKHSSRIYNEDSWDVPESEPGQESVVKLNDNGSILIKDGAGSFIELDGQGGIVLSCSGNVQIRNGGDTAIVSGGDISIRAKENLDVCCTEGDIRMKAEKAVQVFSKDKGILLETESTGVPNSSQNEAHEYSGIIIRAKGEAPITIDSGQNVNLFGNNIISHATSEIRLESALKISLATTSFSAMGIIPVPPSDFTAAPGVPMTSFALNATSMNLSGTTMLANYLTSMHLSSKEIKISGEDDTFIHGGGADGTNVNHAHRLGTDYTLVTDSAGGERVSDAIEKTNANDPAVVPPSIDFPTTTLMTPFTKETIDYTEFGFRTKVFGSDLFEHEWQKIGETWDLFSDNYQDAAPFPGLSFSSYKVYSPADGLTEQAGDFTDQPISSSFKV